VIAMLWIGTSWKMTKSIEESRQYVTALAAATLPDGIRPFILPAHTSLAAVRDCLPSGTRIVLGTQNAHWAAEGAITGEISMRMAADAGARIVEMGHSERREQFGETDETVALKARAAISHGLVPLVCVGEPRTVRTRGDAIGFVTGQLTAALSRLRPGEVRDVLVAYEPVWAIGSGGTPATPQEVAPVLVALAAVARTLSSGPGCLALLYGGGVDTANAAGLLRIPEVDGLFAGRAAWDVDGFLRLLAIGRAHLDRRGAL
jgi:triosephosphate isomerase